MKRIVLWQCDRCGELIEEDASNYNPRYVLTVVADRGSMEIARNREPLTLCRLCWYDVDRVLRDRPVRRAASEE